MNKEDEFIPKDLEFQHLIKSAKRKSLFKMISISAVISLIVIVGLYLIGDYSMKLKMEKVTMDDSAWNSIEGANVEDMGTSFDYSPLSATATTSITKKIDGVPIPWGSQEKEFTFFGTWKHIISVGPESSGSITDERIPSYFQGERVLEFYHPEVKYQRIFDDRMLLEEMGENLLVEMAFSFDKYYTLADVSEKFKEDAVWYWVDTFAKKDYKDMNPIDAEDEFFRDRTVDGFSAIGFSHNDYPNARPEEAFIHTLESLKSGSGRYQDRAKEMYGSLKENGKGEVNPENLRIIGVVVTGSPKELQKYKDYSEIRAAILGATTDKY